MPTESDADRTKRAMRQKLESLQRAGVAQLGKIPVVKVVAQRPAAPRPEAPRSVVPAAGAKARQAAVGELETARKSIHAAATSRADGDEPRPAVGGIATSAKFETPPLAADQRLPALDVLRETVAGCTLCKPLAAARTQTVFGVGNPHPRLCFLGEAPGADEDRQGEPFVGRAGQLLTKIIEACRLRREDVYILNVLKCRPPDNRPPLPDEVTNCRGYFERQFDILRPEFICCLGSTAAKALLNTEISIGKLRGQFHDYRGIEVICTYHPSYLLRNPAAKADVWKDMKVLMARMGIML